MLRVGKNYCEYRRFSQAEVNAFADLTGDNNYLHMAGSPNYDRFDGPIVHGALIMGHFSKILGVSFPGPGTIYLAQDIKYCAPLYVGEEAKYSVMVTETLKPGKAILNTVCSVGDKIICEGAAKVAYKYIDSAGIVEGLVSLGLEIGDTVLVHSSFNSFGPVEGGPQAVIDALTQAVGESGTIIMPTFNFDFTKGIPYSYASTKSHMGIITEIVRTNPKACRVFHPIYGFAILGAKADEFSKINNLSAYGQDSVFAKLREVSGKILILGLSYNDSMTFFHHVEEMVGCEYRYMKEFTGDIVLYNNDVIKKTYSMYVRDIDSGVNTMVNPMGEELEKMGLVRKSVIGRCEAKLMGATDVFEATKNVPHTRPYLLRKIDGEQ